MVPVAEEAKAGEVGRRSRKRRADAVRNEQHLLASAPHTFLREGPQVTMQQIAEDAGVGIGTLYRHFPDRTALLMALNARSFEILLEAARAARQQEPEAPQALLR